MWSTKLPGLSAQERIANRKLMEAIEVARNRHTVSAADRGLLETWRYADLNAANPDGRIKWGNALWSEFAFHFDLSEAKQLPDIPLFWVTLVDIGCFTAIDAKDVNLRMMDQDMPASLAALLEYRFAKPLRFHVSYNRNTSRR